MATTVTIFVGLAFVVVIPLRLHAQAPGNRSWMNAQIVRPNGGFA